MEQVVACFKDYLSVVGYSRSIQSMLPVCVADFLAYGQFTSLMAITPGDIRLFYEWLHTRPLKRGQGALSAQMISHYIYALRVFFNWQEAVGAVRYHPLNSLKFKSGEIHHRIPLTLAEIDQLFTVATSVKEQAVLHLFYSCGLRRSEGERLRLSDVHFMQRLLYVRSGKGERRRVVPLTARVATSLEQYVQQERGRARVSGSAFMLNGISQPMRGSSYLLLLKKLLRRAGLSSDITLHHLRHSIATHLLQNGMSLEYVRDFLGHRYLESAQIYAQAGTHQIQAL